MQEAGEAQEVQDPGTEESGLHRHLRSRLWTREPWWNERAVLLAGAIELSSEFKLEAVLEPELAGAPVSEAGACTLHS